MAKRPDMAAGFKLHAFYKRLPSEQLSNIGFAALLTGFSAFVATFFLSLSNPSLGLGIVKWIGNINSFQSVMVYAATLYMILLMVPLIKLLLGTQSIYRLRRQGLGKVPGPLKIFLLDASQYLNIKRKVSIFTSNLISSPLTVGFLKPVILLPVAMLNQLSMEQAQAIILHELAHIRRNDYLQNLITQVILTILYFNPFIRLLAKMQNLEREKSADNWVMRFEYDSCMYAKTLLLLARQNTATPNKLAVPISGKRSPLLERVEFLLGAGKRRYPSVKSISFLCTLIVSMMLCSLLNKHGSTQTAGINIAWTAQPAAGFQFASNLEQPATEMIHPDPTPEITPEEKTTITETCDKSNPSPKPKTEVVKTEDCVDVVSSRATFVSHFETVMPVLEEKEEKDVQDALKATQKIVVELSWNAIDNSLAETVTQQEKQALKDAYSQKIKTANWQKQADVLRLRYKDINWEKTTKKLALAIADIKVDSIYKEYKNVTQALYGYKQQLEQDSSCQKKKLPLLQT
ncbi:M56 family metallopeptidase [Niabella hibiscisoli]|uniref:M56 family metallopeptidase n=1 Tax=Niabella hibiscisoli TaxID=1825928 RepID=UPI001F0F80D6|nr:M56 family metallopeptidase [Niabella hibiscisoli]MCH5718419.1 M56 family metallopeptidase [Niabella hibiscisoli]